MRGKPLAPLPQKPKGETKMLITSTDALMKAKELLNGFSDVEVELDWYNDDTAYNIMVSVADKGSTTHSAVINKMIKNGFDLIDFDTMEADGDTPLSFCATYFFY